MSTIQFKQTNCKNCYKCLRNCPVKAIVFKDDHAQIVEKDCILCGKCLQVCPQNAKSVINDVDRVEDFIKSGKKVFASIAPSFVTAFDIKNPLSIFQMLKKLGFYHTEETAIGAVQVSIEYDKLLDKHKMENIVTTACPTVVSLVEKYYPELINQLAPVVSPMIAHAKMMKAEYGKDIKVIFIGPCLSKKEEYKDLQNDDVIDAVITFEELNLWFEHENIDIDDYNYSDIEVMENDIARFYPAPGGILKTVSDKNEYKHISVDGTDRCIEVLDSIKNGKVKNYFIEMNSCTGGCLKGPCINCESGFLESRDKLIEYVNKSPENIKSKNMDYSGINFSKKFINMSDELIVPDEQIIQSILNKIGKFDKSKELNCGACGYSTCREKAIAVYNNRAELNMCLPYMRERAESISNIITNATPNAIIALNEDLTIQEANVSAKKIFKLEGLELKDKNIYDFLRSDDFETAKNTGKDIINKKHSYDEYGITVEQSIIYVKEHQTIIVIMKDITEDEKQKQQMYKVRSDTIETTQNVINKQMMVAQEIASLLGETTAETKIALTRLKRSLSSREGEDK